MRILRGYLVMTRELKSEYFSGALTVHLGNTCPPVARSDTKWHDLLKSDSMYAFNGANVRDLIPAVKIAKASQSKKWGVR